ncbi:ABC transporter ATP-binding protein [Streptomyces sp. NPDC041068]|uniref:ABC transporter ATP-binding protein n=1 Tax=Streptomyces sp. NPDC041068 TaxID=3155130 RepID=UPI0033E4EFB8
MTAIEVKGLTKVYGQVRAVDRLTFSVRPGQVTGFLGPNGAGKSTTMRLVLGLDRPSSGTATIGGSPFTRLAAPLRHVGALLDAQAPHGSRTARNHLLALAASNRIPDRRVDEVLGLTGIASAGSRRVRTFSLGMRQRLGIAAALLGDPEVLLLDEPSNGLDPEGIIWIRELMRGLAREGRTVLVSSHLMGETASFADHLIVLGQGRLLADTPTKDFIAARVKPRVRVRTTDPARLREVVLRHGHALVDSDDCHVPADGGTPSDGHMLIDDVRTDAIGALAAEEGIALLELTAEEATLEQAYLDLTTAATEFSARATQEA